MAKSNKSELKWFRARKGMLDGINPYENIILAQDLGNEGAKQFTYRPLKDIPAINQLLENENKNLNEVLLPDRAIKPYFDLEMEGKYDNDDKLNLFLSFVGFEIYQLYNIKLELYDFIILDSCREGKLSFHVLINNKVYFENVAECKKFVQYLTYRFNNPQSIDEQELIDELTWYYKETEKRYIFDCVPYMSYQQIRCINQSKRGKQWILKRYNEEIPMNDYWIALYNGVGDREKLNTEIITIQYQNIKRIQNVNKKVTKPAKKPEENAEILAGHWAENFNTEGATLMIKYGLQYKDLYKFPKWKQYLFLIVNNGLSYDSWRNVGMAIAIEGGTENDWIEWSKLNIGGKNDKYKDGETSAFHKFRKSTVFGENSYDIRTLKKLAKMCNPDFFKEKNECFNEYFDLDLQGIKTINEKSDFLSQEGTNEENNIFTDDKIIVKFAGCGKGKTTSIKRMIKHYNFNKYLFISPRIAFATFISGEFDCDCYINKYSEKMVVSLESIMNIPDDYEYDFIIIDECESVLKQFSSPTMNGIYLKAFERLTTYIKKAKKVVFADAYITKRTIEFCKSTNERITLIINSKSNQNKKAIEIHPDLIEPEMLKSIANNENIYTCFSRKKSLVKLKNSLIQHAPAYGIQPNFIKDSIFYYAEGNDKDIRDLNNINEIWGKSKLIATSPSITVGCSFSPENDNNNPHFDKTYIDAFPTCCVRDCFQQLMRVRHTKTNALFFSLPKKSTMFLISNSNNETFKLFEDYDKHCKFKQTMYKELCDSIIQQKQKKNENCDDIIRIKETLESNDENIPLALRKILFFNLYETTISNCFYNEMFYEFLSRSNYSFERVELETEILEPITEIKNDFINFCNLSGYQEGSIAISNEDDIEEYILSISHYDNANKYVDIIREQLKNKLTSIYKFNKIPLINQEEVEIIQHTIRNKIATEHEKLKLKKFFFLKTLNEDVEIDDLVKSELFFNNWCDSRMKKYYDNARTEKFDTYKTLYQNEISAGGILDLIKDNAMQKTIITNINKKLGLKNSFQEDIIITRQQIENIEQYLTENRKAIMATFHKRDRSQNDEATFTKNLKLLQHIYMEWSNMKLVVNQKDKHTKTPIDFTLTNNGFLNVFDYVK